MAKIFGRDSTIMKKIVGLIVAWYAEDWIDLTIQQALQFCDEVVVSIGAHTHSLAKLKDSTMDKALLYEDRVKFIKTAKPSYHNSCKADTLNAMLKASNNFKAGNWLWILDSDEFYFPATYEIIKDIISANKYDSIKIEAKFFYINMTRYLHSAHGRLFKIKNRSSRFMPTQRWTGGNGRQYLLRRDDQQIGMFHYSLLMPIGYKRLFWQTEKRADQSYKVRWLNNIYATYDLKDEEKSLNRNQRMFNIRSPFYNDQFRPHKNGKLFTYDGLQPPLIQESNLINIDDWRDM